MVLVSSSFPDFPGHDEAMSPAAVPVPLQDRTADSDLSERLVSVSPLLIP